MKKEEILKITQSWLNDCSEKHSLQMIEEVDIMIKYFEELTNIKV